ncbi:MAG: choice-of-anchor D domain-containing protein, partial [Chromatiales bacterium]|nr:choice-of-anchor D domain-containing protein [Chromatiales bacterium]
TGTVYRLASASAHTPEPVNFGNVHVGDTVNQALSITNTAAADGFSENLNASFNGTSGAATASGNFSGLGAQQTDNSSLMVGLNTATAGAVSGSATIDLVSDGAGINTLGQTGIGSQTVNVSGNVFRLAEATVDNPLAFAFGNVHVGDSVMQAVSISNTAADDGFSERLNAAFGSSSDARIQNNGGSFTLLGAQQTDNSSLVVSVDTSSSGVVNGTQTLNFVSDGSGTSELGQTALADQNLAVSAVIQANVFDFANPVINNAQPIDFGNVREGAMVSAQALSITNDVAGMADSLDASVGGTSGGVTTNNGSFTLLAPGATDNTSITVAIDTATAGQKDGNATIDLVSNGTPNGLGLTALPSQDVMVTGNVFRLAEAEVTPDPVVIHARVGDTAQQALTIANSAATDGFSEGLGVSSATAGGDASLSGTVSGIIAAGGSDSGLIVNLDTSTAGAKTGNVDLSYTSDGTGTSGLAAIANGGDTIGVSGNVYQQAVASVIPTSIDFGIVHVGDTVSQSIAVSNIAPVVALNDVLTGTLGSVDGPFTGAGGLGGGVAAGQTDSSSLVVGLDTGTAGVFTDTAQLALQSHNDDLVDLDLGISNISLMAQINEYANPVFELVSGAGSLSGGAFSYQLDLGNIVQGNSALSTLVVRNDVSSPADLLDGDFVLAGGVFDLTGFDAFVDLMAGQATSDLLVALDTSALGLGLFSGQITLGATGHNASGYSQDFDGIILNLRANVIAQNQGGVPTPGTWLLMLFGSGILLFRRVPR